MNDACPRCDGPTIKVTHMTCMGEIEDRYLRCLTCGAKTPTGSPKPARKPDLSARRPPDDRTERVIVARSQPNARKVTP